MTLKTRNAIVTGSISGIGLAIARALAKGGVNVMITGVGDAAPIEAARAGMALPRVRSWITALSLQGLRMQFHGNETARPTGGG